MLATAVRAKLQEVSIEYLRGHPQYAYCPNRAIDEAIGRVTRHCGEVRERVKTAEQSVHDRRAGKQRSTCIGGIMLGVDLSRASTVSHELRCNVPCSMLVPPRHLFSGLC